MRLQCLNHDDGKYYAAEVVEVCATRSDAPVKVHWLGYDWDESVSDEWVGADRIRCKSLKFVEAEAAIARDTEAKAKDNKVVVGAKEADVAAKPNDTEVEANDM